ncbi:hypothetical protein QCA50_008243 [Cerrena zonata]|uniref:DUF6533 domain-containing protein n=1 Tax=Cerrena zonata TaxID=2478898 RepID=A0AAW0GIB7_9APHY
MSDQLGFTPEETIVQISQAHFANYVLTASLTLAVYDTILSFPKEVRCIWQRGYGIGPILYLFIRYCTILDMILQLLEGIPPNTTVFG